MISRIRIRPVDLMVILAIVAYAGARGLDRPAREGGAPSSFAQQVNLEPLYKTAVHADGRLRSFESHAATFMRLVSGPRSINQQASGFTYLDIVFRPDAYSDTDIVYVKNKNVRAKVIDALQGDPGLSTERESSILSSGLVAQELLRRPAVTALLQELGQDLIRTAKDVDLIQTALFVADAEFLGDQLRFIAPPGGRLDEPWLPVTALEGDRGMPRDSVHAELSRPQRIRDLDPGTQDALASSWSAVRAAWQKQDAEGVNAQLVKFAGLLPSISPDLYPSLGRLATESWYFRNKSMTWVWLVYLAAVVPLLICVVYKWDGARKIGMGLFSLAFLAHTVSLAVRWYISGRWPNTNMFEAVTTAAWFGGVAALILEWITRRTAFRNLFALGSALISMAALMAAYYLPAELDSSISNKMAALNDVWLYIHTNMIIWSYAIIGLACVPALLLLRHRWCVLWDQPDVSKARLLLVPVALGVLNYTAYLLLMHCIANASRGLEGRSLGAVIGGMGCSLMIVLLEIQAARARRSAGIAVERSSGGGAAVLFGGSSAAVSSESPRGPTATEVFDAGTMILVEVALIMLWTGTVMGAIWADHSWGRPWGWDPKEVFALNTFIIFLVLIHVRLRVRDKAFWTAVLAIVGFEVMMFNWIVVNFIITGLHSYA